MARRFTPQSMTRSLSFGAAATDRVDCGTDWIGTGDITVCGWINPKDLGGSSKGRILDNGKFYFLVSGTFPNIALEAYSDGSANFGNSNPGKLLPNSWSFVSLTRAATTGTVSFRIDGIDQTSDSSTATPEAGSTNVFIGNRNATDRNFNGKIKNLQVFNRILTTTEQDNIYYAGIMPSDYATSIIRDFRFLENDTATTIYSYNNNSQTGTITGATYSNDVPLGRRITPRFMGGSTLFDGSSSVVKITNRPIYNLVNYSVSFWMKSVKQADDKNIISNGYSISNTPQLAIVYKQYSGNDYGLRPFIRDDSNTTLNGSDITPLNLIHGRWYHVVLTDAGGSLKCYINGVYQGINLTYTRGTLTLNQTAFGASWRTGTGQYWNGNLSEVKIFNSVLTASQAAELYSTGSVSGVSPVANYALDDQPSTYIDSIGANNGTGTATTYSSDTPTGLRLPQVSDTASLDFLAGSSKVSVADVAGLNPTSFSVFCYAKIRTLSANDEPLISKYSTVALKRGFQLTVKSTGFVLGSVSFDGNTDSTVTSNTKPPLNRWCHFALTFNGTKLKFYLNGKLDKESSASGSLYPANISFDVGHIYDFADHYTTAWISKTGFVGRAITQTEILDAMNNKFPSDSILLWKFTEGAGSTATDSSGNGNNGTITGATWSSDTPSKARITAGTRTTV